MYKDFDIDSIKLQTDKSTLLKEPALDIESYNVTATEQKGTGPRYGMSPLPGQYHAEGTDVTLLSSEGTTTGYSNRNRIFGIMIQKMQRNDAQIPVPIFICSSERNPGEYTLDPIVPGDASGPLADLAATLLDSTIGSLDHGLKNWRLTTVDARKITLKNRLTFAQLNIGLAEMQVPYQLVDVVSHETATNPGYLDYSTHGYDYYMAKNRVSNLTISNIFVDSGKSYFGVKHIYDANTATWTIPSKENDGGTHFLSTDSDRREARLAAPAYSNASSLAVVYADSWRVSQSHAVLAWATGTSALLAVLRDERDPSNLPFQYCDPSESRLSSTRTLIESGLSSYTIESKEHATGWAYFPAYSGTSLPAESGEAYDGSIHVRLGAANSGLLRSELLYELAYSLFDVSTGTETNVCTPVLIKTGADDYVAFSVFRNVKDTGVFTQRIGYDLNVPVQKVPIEKVNYIQYRFYYRAVGSAEWLPAGHYWATDYLFNGQNEVLWCATGAMGASIGGDIGQFNDFSPLPRDNWFDVCVFQNRFFWCSTKQAIFSLRDNALAYPVRNSISLPSGEFRGLTVHCFYGQSQQTGRVVFWASDAQYEGKFTGSFAQWSVSVSPTSQAQFPLDGSDFIVQFRSSFTAFSSKAAVVAEGALFFWGEAGIYADDGVAPPNKISQTIEPWVGKVYDTGRISEIHCYYNECPKEIVWFYPPRVNSGFLTEALVFNAEKNSFQRIGFGTQIDWSQNLNITQEGARKRLMLGKRIALGHQRLPYAQRMVFADVENQCGDLYHGREYLVKEIQATPTGSRLILAFGFDIPSFADIPVGTSFLIHQSFEYTETEPAYDGRYVTIDIGPYYLDISDTLTPATFTNDRLMPIWIDLYSSIPFKLKTLYIVPGEFWQMYSIVYIMVSLRLLSDIMQNFSIGIFTNISSQTNEQMLTLEKNANTHCMRRLSFPHFEDTTHGIGFGLSMRGDVNGAQWRIDRFSVLAEEGEDFGRFEQT